MHCVTEDLYVRRKASGYMNIICVPPLYRNCVLQNLKFVSLEFQLADVSFLSEENSLPFLPIFRPS